MKNDNATAPGTQASSRPALTLRSFDEILAMQFDESDNILGDRQLAKSQNACIVGPSGAGKTRLILQMAAAGIAKRDFLGLPMNGSKLRWLFLQVENSNRRLQIDLTYLRQWVGPEKWPSVQAQCVVHTLENDSDGIVFLNDYAAKNAISEAIEVSEPDVVVWDSLQNFAVGDLNKDMDMFHTLSTLSLVTKRGNPGRIPLVVHHTLTGRLGAVKALGIDRAGYSRNSKSMHAWTRSQINVAVASPDSYETIILSCGKCSDGKEFTPFAAAFNEQTHIYERDPDFDLEEWLRATKSSNRGGPIVSDEVLLDVLNGNAMSKSDLYNAIRERITASKATIYRAIDRAVHRRKLKLDKSTETYTRRSP